jgi:hypothetical protein
MNRNNDFSRPPAVNFHRLRVSQLLMDNSSEQKTELNSAKIAGQNYSTRNCPNPHEENYSS